MSMFSKMKDFWGAIQWKMLIIFAFFSVLSTILVACFAVAVLNVVIRRESAYLIEERIKVLVDHRAKLTESLIDRVPRCPAAASTHWRQLGGYLDAMWPAGQTLVTLSPGAGTDAARPDWLDTSPFVGVVADGGHLEIRSFRTVEREKCSFTLFARIPFNDSLLEQLSGAAGLQVANSKPVLLRPYRAEKGIRGEIEANFIPGSRRPVPVVVIARNWQTGRLEDWVVCQVRPSYSRTIEDLSHMGLRVASWVSPLGGIALALIAVYGVGLLLALQLSRRIVDVVGGLSHAASLVGKGDFSFRIADTVQDQLGQLAASFNVMTHDLDKLRKQERRHAVLERDIELAREAQQFLYPRRAPVLSMASVWGITEPARIVGGDLYDFLSFSSSEVGLWCADVSGKGMSAALIMANLQAIAHGRLLMDASNTRPSPHAFVTALNREIQGRFGDARYATMFYGEFDSESRILRYVNAGHIPPILITETGEATILPGGDLPVGLFPDAEFEERRVLVPRGGSIVVCTDGVTEALNAEGEEFGEAGTMSCLKSLPEGADAESICKHLARSVAEWAAGVERFDDTTILVLSVK